jgi:epoxyqueuosine reductase QueG
VAISCIYNNRRTMKTNDHPTVRLLRQRPRLPPRPLDREALRKLALEAGADDVGFVSVSRPEIAGQRPDILSLFPHARTLVAFVVRMNRDAIRSPARSVANLEFHRAGDETNDVARRIVRKLNELGYGAVNPAMGFPMEMDRFPAKTFVLSHKPVAVAAGLGMMGIHRNVIHPRFGNFILLGTVVTDVPLETDSVPLDFNPCLECKLCVAACPVGAISHDGAFDVSACYTHNYREFTGGFIDWVEQIASSRNAREYRARVTDAESASMWQSLSFGANYKAAYCLAVCPAGEDVIGPFLDSRTDFLNDVVKPLQDKVEPVYVLPDSDAEDHVRKRFSHKHARRVRSGIRIGSVAAFARGLPLRFQRGRARDISLRVHFSFRGTDRTDLMVVIGNQSISVENGLGGEADLHVETDTRTWLAVLNGERSLLGSLLMRRIRVRGPLRLLREFRRCFPSDGPSERASIGVKPSGQRL